jgi:virulence-associated protein VapD
MDTMFKILAVLGALAWLPQLFIFIREIFTKPVIKIIPENQLEIGFTTYGPIINMTIAIISEKQKALIDNIEVELTHENNDIQKFKWKWFEETLHTVDLPDQSLPTRKNQTAIALNLQKDQLVEKKIGFQQKSFQSEQKTIVQNTIEEAINLSKAGKENKELMATKNYNDLNSLYQNGFNWKVGKYSIKYKVYENSLKTPFIKEVIFKMTSLDVSNLTNNIEKCHTEIERNYVGTEFENPTWNWANITIEE